MHIYICVYLYELLQLYFIMICRNQGLFLKYGELNGDNFFAVHCSPTSVSVASIIFLIINKFCKVTLSIFELCYFYFF